uniref:Non-haem dioxygenase N-terminal domain-containing protein n=1 Tax=Aegilops tauschii subsp. strangulata TaxID=200361 RepID=A0A453DBY9_AEGTS
MESTHRKHLRRRRASNKERYPSVLDAPRRSRHACCRLWVPLGEEHGEPPQTPAAGSGGDGAGGTAGDQHWPARRQGPRRAGARGPGHRPGVPRPGVLPGSCRHSFSASACYSSCSASSGPQANDTSAALKVVNHGVSKSAMDDALEAASEFFDMPAERKAAFACADIRSPVRYDTSSKDGISKARSFLKHYANPLDHWVDSWPTQPATYR